MLIANLDEFDNSIALRPPGDDVRSGSELASLDHVAFKRFVKFDKRTAAIPFGV